MRLLVSGSWYSTSTSTSSQTRVGEVLGEHGQAARPRVAFGGAHAVPAHPDLLGDAVGQRALRGEAKKTGRGDAERRH